MFVPEERKAFVGLFGPRVASTLRLSHGGRAVAFLSSYAFLAICLIGIVVRRGLPGRFYWLTLIPVGTVGVLAALVWMITALVGVRRIAGQYTGGSRSYFVWNAPVGRPSRFPAWCAEHGYRRASDPPS